MLPGDDPLSAAGRSGLFLSAPRRTGKSTFLRNDLIPAVEKAGAVAIYVDLWADKTRDAGDLIAEAIRDALVAHSGKLARGLRALTRIKKAGAKGELGGFKGEFGFELETIIAPPSEGKNASSIPADASVRDVGQPPGRHAQSHSR